MYECMYRYEDYGTDVPVKEEHNEEYNEEHNKEHKYETN